MTDQAPQRLRLSRAAGFRLQEHSLALNGLRAVSVARPGYWGNPFFIGGYHMVGGGGPGFSQLTCLDPSIADDRFTLVDTAEKAVAMFSLWVERYPRKGIEALRGKNLACWCSLGEPCHADILLKLAN